MIRHYHGHLSAVYSLALHPAIDVLITAGRDSTARVWDMRTKANVHTLTGHTNTVASVIAQTAEPQVLEKLFYILSYVDEVLRFKIERNYEYLTYLRDQLDKIILNQLIFSHYYFLLKV